MSVLTAGLTRDEALKLLKTYNSDPFHLRHGLTVSAVMEWMAGDLGRADEAEFWARVGLLHDVDFEQWPEEHCVKAAELLGDAGCTPEFIHAVACHGWGMTGTSARPEAEMEKVLFAVDELSGLIWAAALVRPSKSVQDLELKSVKKKFKDKRFAAGCSRDVIEKGAEMLGWSLDDLISETILAMRSLER